MPPDRWTNNPLISYIHRHLPATTLTVARAFFVVVATASLALYAVYLQAALRYWEQGEGLFAIVTTPFQLAALLVIEGTLAFTFWGASIYLVMRRPDSRMVLMAATVGFMMPVRVAFIHVVPLEALPTWYSPQAENLFWAVFATLAYFVFAVFPDGALRPRWVCWCLGARLFVTANLALNVVPLLNELYIYLDIFMYGVLMVAQYQRFCRDRISIERQQTKWVLLGISVGLVFFFLRRLADVHLHEHHPELYFICYGLSRLAVMTIPVAITFALLRYRLYDVDWVLNRSLVYSSLTATVVVVFSLISLASQVFVAWWLRTADAQLMSFGLTTVSVGLLLMPTRAMLQRLVDQHVFRLRLPLAASAVARSTSSTPSWEGAQLGSLSMGTMIAHGSIGEVYMATYQGRRVAVKLLPRQSLSDEAVCALLQREVRLFQGLSHPNICQMLSGGVYNSVPYIVMEYVEGEELERVLAARKQLTLAEARLILRDVAAALDYLHERNIVHGDVKPRNILLQDVRAVLTDFGTARYLTDATTAETHLLTTPDYAAPEQLCSSVHATRATDIYALGVVAYRLLTGHKPFTGNLRQKLLAILHAPPRDPREFVPTLPSATACAILRALDKEPTRRFPTAGAFARAV